jgi:haloalkane dehalogenase
MESVRTSDDRFRGLPDWPYAPHYAEVPDGEGGALRMHYVDQGPRGAAPVLCLHGQPTWSYLYRKMIPLFVAAGRRVIAPDLVGFGRSDKPTRPEDYTYSRHVGWLRALLEAIDLRGATLIGQDWGGLVGLRVLVEAPERFARVVVSNTGLPDGSGIAEAAVPALRVAYAELPVPQTMADVAKGFLTAGSSGAHPFQFWQKFAAESPGFRAGAVLQALCPRLSPAEVAGYDAPFPDERHLAGARRFPSLVPILPDDSAVPDNRRAWEHLRAFEKPFLTAFTDADPVTKGQDARFRAEVPGARGQPHATIAGAGHFVQEDAGEELARITLDFIAETRGA